MKTVINNEVKSEYNELANKALPNCMIKYIDNFDDVFWGFEIVPSPGKLLLFQIMIENEFRIRIRKLEMYYYSGTESKLYDKIIYDGSIPSNQNMEPDFDFIKQILRNWASF